MTETQEIPWKRLSAEAAAIVGSILLAFSIDAWWENRQEASDVRNLLSSIREDVRVAQDFVDGYRIMSVARQESALTLLRASTDDDLTLDRNSIDSLIGDLAWWVEPFVVSGGSVEALITSGSLGLVRSPKLRAELAGWTSFVENSRFNIQPDYRYYFDVFQPFMRRNANSYQIYMTMSHIPGRPNDPWQNMPKISMTTADHSILLQSQEFQNILADIILIQDDLRHEFDRWDARLSVISPLIENELEY